MIALLRGYVESRRAVRRTTFAVALLRKEATSLRRARDRETAGYLDSLADLIEAAP